MWVLICAVFVLVVLIDQVSKYIIASNWSASPHAGQSDSYWIRPTLNFRLGMGWFPAVPRQFYILLIIGLGGMMVLLPPALPRDLWLTTGLALGIAGGVSNLLDFCRKGATLDFIRIPRFAIFNLADVAICMGVCLCTWRLMAFHLT